MRGAAGWRRWVAGCGLLAAAALTGCDGGFFVDSTTGTTTNSSGNYAYVVNQTTNTLSEFVVGTGTLTAVSGSPIALTAGLAAASVAVSRANTFVYVGGNGAITCYSIGTGGALTAVTAGAATAIANFVSLDTSPDGKWLFGLDSTTLAIYVYGINTSTGALSLNSTATYGVPGAGVVSQRSLHVSPSGGLVAVTLGPGGDLVYTFSRTTGVLTGASTIAVPLGSSDNAGVFDTSSTHLLLARGGATSGTGTVVSFTVSSAGVLSGGNSYAVGNAPFSIVLDPTGAYAYVANRGDATVSGFALSAGVLTALASSPYPSGSSVVALSLDKTGTYLLAAASGGSSDVTLYGFDAITAGKLNAVAVAASGTDPAGSLAVASTH